jgi:hypothetical protein
VTDTKEHLDRGVGVLPGEERRRSQRVVIRVPVTLHASENGQPVKASADTVAVNIHGAMVVCKRSFEAETMMELVNERTGQKIGARVTRAPRESAEGFLVPLEFVTASPNFWQISFPPTNWKAPEF